MSKILSARIAFGSKENQFARVGEKREKEKKKERKYNSRTHHKTRFLLLDYNEML